MATPKKSSSSRKTGYKPPQRAASKKAVSGRMAFFITSILLALLGTLLFQFGIFRSAGIQLLKYKNFLPRQIVKTLPGGSAADGKAVISEVLTGEIIEVYDGDTAMLLMPERNRKYKIRFYGIDAPEKDQSCGNASRDALRKKILGKQVKVEVINIDAYGRSVGRVLLEGRNINQEMIREGYAWHYRDYAKHEYTFAEAEKQARKEYLGLWRDADPVPPWEFRRKNKK